MKQQAYIKVNGIMIPLLDSMSIQDNAPWVSGQSLRGSYTYPFEFADTPEARKALNWPEDMQVPVAKNGFLCSVWDGDIFVNSGVLYITTGDHNTNTRTGTIQGQITFAKGAIFANIVNNKTLKVLQMDGVRNIPGKIFDPAAPDFTALKQTVQYATDIALNGDDYICFPTIYSKQFHAESYAVWAAPTYPNGRQYSYGRYLNHWDIPSGSFTQTIFFDNTAGTDTAIPSEQVTMLNYLVPMYYYHQVLRHCFKEFGYSLTGDFINEDWFKKIIIVNNYSISLYNNLTIYQVITGEVEIAAHLADMPTTIQASNHLPNIAIVDFVTQFMTAFNCWIDFNGNQATVYQNQVEKIQGDLTKQAMPGYLYNIPTPDENNGIELNYKENTSDPQTSFLNDDDNDIVPKPSFLDNNGPDFADTPYVEVANWAEFIVLPPNTLALIRSLNIFIYQDFGSGAWQYNAIRYTNGLQPTRFDFDLAPALTTIKLTGYPPNTTPYNYDGTYITDMLLLQVKGSYTQYNTTIWQYEGGGIYSFVSTESPVLVQGIEVKYIAFYHDFPPNISPGDFAPAPFASSNNYYIFDGVSEIKLGPWHLGWWGTEGIVTTFWKNMMPIFFMTKLPTINLPPDLKFIFAHKWNESYLYQGKKFFVSARQYSLPLTDAIQYVGYPLNG